MNTETLRRAVVLMRERAGYATPGPWNAGMDPAVALAVADWLDTAGADLRAHGPLCACGSGCHDCDDDVWQPHVRHALTVARAYLEEQA